MYRQIIGPTILLLFFAGCGRTQYIVLRDVPPSPSFVVIPANDYLYEVEFANHIENALISAGAKVVIRPATKEVMTEQTVRGLERRQTEGQQSNLGAGAKLTEKYVEYEDIDAGYIVRTYKTSRQVKISKKETREILAILVAPTHDPIHGPIEWWHKEIYKTLKHLLQPR